MASETPIRLIYHYYIDTAKLEDEITKIHYTCLSKYAEIFTDVTFIISIDDTSDYKTITNVESKLCSLGFRGNIIFKVIKNDPILREVETFKNEIADKFNELEGLTFFAHNKGTTNERNEDVKSWIISMYYFSLNFIEEVKHYMLEYNACMFYGPNMCRNTEDEKGIQGWNNKYGWAFPGTFYWMNTKRIYKYMQENNSIILFDNRYAAEIFPGELCEMTKKIARYHSVYYGVNFHDWYHNAVRYLKTINTEKDFNDFKTFYDKIIKEINE